MRDRARGWHGAVAMFGYDVEGDPEVFECHVGVGVLGHDADEFEVVGLNLIFLPIPPSYLERARTLC